MVMLFIWPPQASRRVSSGFSAVTMLRRTETSARRFCRGGAVLSRFQLISVTFAVLLAGFVLPPLPTLSDSPDIPGLPGPVLAQEIEGSDAVEVQGLALVAPDGIEVDLFNLANRDRIANGLPSLQLDSQLLDVARVRAAAQTNQASLSHVDAAGQLVFVRLISET